MNALNQTLQPLLFLKCLCIFLIERLLGPLDGFLLYMLTIFLQHLNNLGFLGNLLYREGIHYMFRLLLDHFLFFFFRKGVLQFFYRFFSWFGLRSILLFFFIPLSFFIPLFFFNNYFFCQFRNFFLFFLWLGNYLLFFFLWFGGTR